MSNFNYANYTPDGDQALPTNSLPYKSSFIIAQSAVASSITNDLTETVLGRIIIPGGIMGLNGALRINTLWSGTASANNKILRVRHGGTQILGITATTSPVMQHVVILRNRGVINSQVMFVNASTSYTAAAVSTAQTSTINTDVDQILTITGQLANLAELITLEGYIVEVLPGV